MKKALSTLIALTLALGLTLVPAASASANESSIEVDKTEMNGLTWAYVGDTLRYEYDVYIPAGYMPIHNVTLTDNAGTAAPGDDWYPDYISGDTNGNDILEDGEHWIYRSDPYTITSQTPDPFLNEATAAGKDPDEVHVEGNDYWEVDILPPPAVGGDVHPINKVGVLAPWLGLILILAIGGGIFALRRRLAH